VLWRDLTSFIADVFGDDEIRLLKRECKRSKLDHLKIVASPKLNHAVLPEFQCGVLLDMERLYDGTSSLV